MSSKSQSRVTELRVSANMASLLICIAEVQTERPALICGGGGHQVGSSVNNGFTASLDTHSCMVVREENAKWQVANRLMKLVEARVRLA